MDTKDKTPPDSAPLDEATISQPVVSPQPKRHTALFSGIIALGILLAGGTVWLYMSLNRDVAQSGSSPITSTKTTAQDNVVYLEIRHDDGTSEIRSLNLATKQVDKLMSAKTNTSAVTILPSGQLRRLVFTSQTDTNQSSVDKLSFQDPGKTPQVAFSEVVANSQGTISKTIWPGPINQAGTKGYFFESDNMADTVRIASVDQKGVVTDIITGHDSFNTGLDGVKGVLVPQAVSPDEKTLYLQSLSCLNCDGPPHGDLIAYNIAAKKFSLLQADLFSDGANTYGSWRQLNNRYTLVYGSSTSNFGPLNYTAALSSKDRLYVVDLQTGKSTKVFESSGSDTVATPLQLSADGNTLYYFTQSVLKGNPTPADKNTPADFTYSYATNQVYAYNIATAQTSTIDFGLEKQKVQPVFLTSVNDTYVLAIQQYASPFATNDQTLAATQSAPKVVYTARKSAPTQLQKIYQTEPEKYLTLSWGGFLSPQ